MGKKRHGRGGGGGSGGGGGGGTGRGGGEEWGGGGGAVAGARARWGGGGGRCARRGATVHCDATATSPVLARRCPKLNFPRASILYRPSLVQAFSNCTLMVTDSYAA